MKVVVLYIGILEETEKEVINNAKECKKKKRELNTDRLFDFKYSTEDNQPRYSEKIEEEKKN